MPYEQPALEIGGPADAASMDIAMASKGRPHMMMETGYTNVNELKALYNNTGPMSMAVTGSSDLQAGGLSIIQGTMPAGIYLDPNSIAVQ